MQSDNRRKSKIACVDGPEFDGDQVNFDEAMRRQNMYKTEEGRNILEIEDGETHHNPSCPNHEIIVDKKKRVPVREQEPDIRNKNFEKYVMDIIGRSSSRSFKMH